MSMLSLISSKGVTPLISSQAQRGLGSLAIVNAVKEQSATVYPKQKLLHRLKPVSLWGNMHEREGRRERGREMGS